MRPAANRLIQHSVVQFPPVLVRYVFNEFSTSSMLAARDYHIANSPPATAVHSQHRHTAPPMENSGNVRMQEYAERNILTARVVKYRRAVEVAQALVIQEIRALEDQTTLEIPVIREARTRQLRAVPFRHQAQVAMADRRLPHPPRIREAKQMLWLDHP